MSVTRPAAAILDPARHSALQPATSAAKVEKFKMNIPIITAVIIAFAISFSAHPLASAAPSITIGGPRHAPALGSATITPYVTFNFH
jgi:hypothetical protein